MVEHFYSIKQLLRHILYTSFSRDTFVFVNGNLSHLTFIVEKQHFDNRSVCRFSMHNLGPFVTTSESYFIIMISDRQK